MGNKQGRTRKYHPDMCDELIKLLAKGYLNCEVYAHWDISEQTFYNWVRDIPDFKEALQTGLPKCEAYWCGVGRKGMNGEIKGYNFNSWISFMNNKFKWAKNAAQEGTTNTININNMNILENKSSPDLIKYITSTIEKHKDIVDIQLIEDQIEENRDTINDTSKPE